MENTQNITPNFWEYVEKLESNLVENRVSQAASLAVPEPNAFCENCYWCENFSTTELYYCDNSKMDEMFNNETGRNCIYNIKEFGCNQFKQK